MVRKARAPHISLEAQLQQLTLLSDIDTPTDNYEQLGPIIKNLDESHQQDEFLKQLREFVRKKDEEIEQVCNENHQEFVSAVDELLIVRSGTVNLKQRINELNQEIQASGQALFSKKKDLIDKQRTVQNVDEAIETLQEFQTVLDVTILVEELISQQKYYSALRRLDEIANIHLKPIMQHELAKLIRDNIPHMRERIRMEVLKQLKGWMLDVREKSAIVGRIALETMEARQQRWLYRSRKDPMFRLSSINSPIEQIVNERIEVNYLENDRVKIDFKPLYQCIHIYEVLDQREKLQANYQEDRKAQANLLLSRSLNMAERSSDLISLLEELVGYFVIECHVSYTSPPGFRPMSEVEDVWDSMSERVVDMITFSLRDTKNAKVFVEAKTAIHTFIRTLESFEFSVSRLNALVLSFFRRFAQLLRERFAADFQQAIREAQHQPMIVNDATELAKVLSVCWLKPGEAEQLGKQPFPLSLPFSQTYPLCCMDIRSLVEQYYSFSQGMTQYHQEIDAILSQSLDDLLIQLISVNIRDTVEQSNNLSQIAQIIVNIEHFQLACSELEKWLSDSSTPNPGSQLILGAAEHLSTTMSIAQKRIDSAMFVKLDQFLDLLEYDWMPVQNVSSQHQASGYLRDLVDWLSTMMDSALVLLPKTVKDTILTSCFMHISNRLLNFALLDRHVRMINLAALCELESDVTFLYQYGKSLHVPDIENVFGQIRQTLGVILSESVSEYALSQQARTQKFPQVQPVKVAAILDKLCQGYAHLGMPELSLKCKREYELVMRLNL